MADDAETGALYERLEQAHNRLIESVEKFGDESESIRELFSWGPRLGHNGPGLVRLVAIQVLRAKRRKGEPQAEARPGRKLTIEGIPFDLKSPTAPPRELRGFAARARRFATDSAQLFSFPGELALLLADAAESYADLFEENPVFRQGHRARGADSAALHKRGGRKLDPATPVLDTLDVMLSEIPAAERRALIGRIAEEHLGVANSAPEQIRARLRDFRKRSR